MGTIWWALSKPPQRWHGPDPRPLWLLVVTPSAIRPELTTRRTKHNLPIRMSTYIIFLPMLSVYRFLLPLPFLGSWFLVYTSIMRLIYTIFKCVPSWMHGCCGEWEGSARKLVNHTSWVAVVTPTDRPTFSVRNRCVIDFFVALFVLSLCPFWQFCWYRAFCHRIEPDIFLFSLKKTFPAKNTKMLANRNSSILISSLYLLCESGCSFTK